MNGSSRIKKTVKRCIQHAAALSGRHIIPGRDPQLLVLMYHRILPQDDKRSLIEEPGMTVTPETFRQHLQILGRYFSFIKLSDWVQLKADGRELPHKACAITFDDGWADNYEFAFPVLEEFNVPATIFLVSDMIDTKEMFWPERLARLVYMIADKYPQYWSHPELEWLQKDSSHYRFSQDLPTRDELSELIASAKDYADSELHERITHIENVLKLEMEHPQPSLLDWQQVKEMVDSGLVEMGSHTCHHVRLNSQTPEESLVREIIDSKNVIEDKCGQRVKTFCFPNGDFCPAALTLVKQNYLGAVTTKKGWNTAASESHQLHRIGVHQDIAYDTTAFLSRISGWM